MLVLVGFLLVALGYGYWTYLALAGGLPLFGATMLVQALALAVMGTGRWLRPLAAATAALQVLGYFLVQQDPVAIAIDLLVVAGLALVAWKGALAPGAHVAAAGFALSLGGSLLAGQTFLLPGTALGLAGWAALSWAALRGHSSDATRSEAHAGARP